MIKNILFYSLITILFFGFHYYLLTLDKKPTETFNIFLNPKYTLVKKDNLLKLWKVEDKNNTGYVADFIGHPDVDLLSRVQVAQVGNLSLLKKGNSKIEFNEDMLWQMCKITLIFYELK